MSLAIAMLLSYIPFFIWAIKEVKEQAKEDVRRPKNNKKLY